MRKLVLILFACLWTLPVFAQNENHEVIDADGNKHYGGLIPLPEDYYDQAVRENKVSSIKKLYLLDDVPEVYDPRGVLFNNIQSMNQGGLGSCYAFAGAQTMFYAELVALSRRIGGYNEKTKDIIDRFIKTQRRSPHSGMRNCTSYWNGGWYMPMFDLAVSKGAALLSDVPYSTSSAKTCNFLNETLKIADWKLVEGASGRPSSTDIKKAVHQYGAVAIATMSSCLSKGQSQSSCMTTSYNHAVVIIGWTKTHYIIQNSWDSSYNSYYYMPINSRPYNVAYVDILKVDR